MRCGGIFEHVLHAKIYKNKRHRSIGQRPGTKSDLRPTNKQVINRFSIASQPVIVFLLDLQIFRLFVLSYSNY